MVNGARVKTTEEVVPWLRIWEDALPAHLFTPQPPTSNDTESLHGGVALNLNQG